jgi:acyl carrier protein
MNEQVVAKVRAIVSGMIGLEEEEITLDSDLREDLEADATDLLEIIGELAEEYDIQITDEEAVNARTVRDLVDLVEKKTKNTV